MKATISLTLACVVLAACVHHAPVAKPVVKDDPPPPRQLRLAVLPADTTPFPNLAKQLNDALDGVKIDGLPDVFHSKVSMEVVQLAIECPDATDACAVAAGKSLSADRLLYASIKRTRKHDKGVTVTLTFYDVDAGTTIKVLTKRYHSEKRAMKELGDLLEQLPTTDTPQGGGAAEAARAAPR